MFCEECGNKIPEDAKFCPKCGTPCSDDNNVPETNGGTKAGKKPKKRRKKNKAVIALCTAVVVVGASVGGFALYQNYEKKASAQRAYDLFGNYYGLQMNREIPPTLHRCWDDYEDSIVRSMNCKINYDTLTKDEKKEFNEKCPDIKKYYSFYPIGNYELFDVYTEIAFETKGISDDIKNLSKDVYHYASITSYRIEDGKIYAECDVNKLYSESEGNYKYEGELAPDEIPFKYGIDYLRKHKKEVKKSIQELGDRLGVSEKMDGVKYNYEDELKKYEKYIEKWNTAPYIYQDEHSFQLLIYKIKDYKNGTLIIEDCYRSLPESFKSFERYIIDKYCED